MRPTFLKLSSFHLPFPFPFFFPFSIPFSFPFPLSFLLPLFPFPFPFPFPSLYLPLPFIFPSPFTSSFPSLSLFSFPSPIPSPFPFSSLFPNRVFTRSSKRPALARVIWIYLLEVCWTFAGSCKHPITLPLPLFISLPLLFSFHSFFLSLPSPFLLFLSLPFPSLFLFPFCCLYFCVQVRVSNIWGAISS